MSFCAASSVLVIAAHPDDETLGCGGTIARWVREGAQVAVVFLADGVGSRSAEAAPESKALAERRHAAKQACEALGVVSEMPQFGELPDNQLDTIPLLTITRQVEAFIEQYCPDTVLTHHAGDLNIDHRRVHEAVVTACRPQPGHPARRLLFFEVPSSTEWQPPGSAPAFTPNVFVDISSTLERKLEALQIYGSEMRPWPHARSLKAVEYLARWRGASVGMAAAEAFILGRELS